MSQVRKLVKTNGRMLAFLRSKRERLKRELDRVYYTLPLEEIRPLMVELKDTVDALGQLEVEDTVAVETPRRKKAA